MRGYFSKRIEKNRTKLFPIIKPQSKHGIFNKYLENEWKIMESINYRGPDAIKDRRTKLKTYMKNLFL